MNRYLKTGLLLLLCTAVEAQSNSKGQLVVSLENPGKPGMVDINLVYGSIHVQAYAGNDVIVDASGELPVEKGQGMKRLVKGNPLGLSAEEKSNHVTISTNSALFPVNVSIKLPRRTSLKLRTYDKGDIIVENVIGTMEVENVNGSITLNNVGGSIIANTYNGLLKASFLEVSPDRPMAFSSMGGRIDLSYPASLKANLKVKSENGEVFSDFDIAQSASKTIKSTSSGVNKSTLDDWLYGKISGGGPEIMISNYYGNIYIKKLK